MAKVMALHMDAAPCTEHGDCIEALPGALRKLESDGSLLTDPAKRMTECPGHAVHGKE